MGKHEGIEVRHEKACQFGSGRRCNCSPSYRAAVWTSRDRKLIRRTFPTLAAAKAWRHDAKVGLRRGTLRAPSRQRVDQAAEAFLAGARDGSVRNRSGDPYKPSVIRSYETALRRRILPAFGGYRLSDVRHVDVQDFADQLVAEELSPSSIRNTLLPLRVIYRRALARGEVGVNPTAGIELPAVRGKRERIADAEEAAALIAGLPVEERALWASAMYAGLRLGELLGATWADLNLADGTIRIERAWDLKDGEVAPKSAAGRRTVPMAAVLRDHLIEHRMNHERTDGLVFGRSPERPFTQVPFARVRHERGSEATGEDRASRVQAQLRGSDDRERGQRQGALDVHGPLLDPSHVRQLRPPNAGQRGGGSGAS